MKFLVLWWMGEQTDVIQRKKERTNTQTDLLLYLYVDFLISKTYIFKIIFIQNYCFGCGAKCIIVLCIFVRKHNSIKKRTYIYNPSLANHDTPTYMVAVMNSQSFGGWMNGRTHTHTHTRTYSHYYIDTATNPPTAESEVYVRLHSIKKNEMIWWDLRSGQSRKCLIFCCWRNKNAEIKQLEMRKDWKSYISIITIFTFYC